MKVSSVPCSCGVIKKDRANTSGPSRSLPGFLNFSFIACSRLSDSGEDAKEKGTRVIFVFTLS